MLEAWDARKELVPLREFLRRQTEKTWEKQIECVRGASEGVLFVLPSSYSITPSFGVEGALQQMVGGAQ